MAMLAGPSGNHQRRPAAADQLRVVAVLDTWIISGPGRQLTALAGALAPLGVELLIVMFQRDSRAPSPFIDYLARHGVRHVVVRDRGRFDLEALRQLGRVIDAFQPHVVQTHGYRPTGLIRLLRLRRRSWSWIGFFHGATRQDWKDRAYNRLNLLMLRGAERLVVLSAEHREWFASMGERVSIIPNACLALPEVKVRLDLGHLKAPGRVLVGVAARLSYEKGVDLLVAAIAGLRSDGLDVQLLIAGDGPEEASLRRQALTLQIAEAIHFLGRVEDVIGFYRQIDVLVIPSREGAEGLPNVLLEAVGADLPVVATRVAAIPEVLDGSPAGHLVPPHDIRAMQAAIRAAVQDGRSEVARAARRDIVARFSLERRAAQHVALYRDLIGGRTESFGDPARLSELPAR